MPRRRSSAVIDEALWPLFGNCASRRSSCRASSHPVVHPTKTATCDRLRARRNYHGRFDRAALNGPIHRPTDAYLLRDLAPLTPSRNYSCEYIYIYSKLLEILMNVFRCDTEIVHLSNNIEYAETYRRTVVESMPKIFWGIILHLLS